jgi:hypothetical protein
VLFLMYPNLNGLGNILISGVCATPLSFISFFSLRSVSKVKPYQRYVLPALIFPLISGLLIGWSLFQQRPENIFKVFVADPIPVGVSKIQAYDISVGIDQEIIAKFNATPEAINEIIKSNKLVLVEESNMINDPQYEFFNGVEWNEKWTTYEYKSSSSLTTMWVSPDGNIVLFRWISF